MPLLTTVPDVAESSRRVTPALSLGTAPAHNRSLGATATLLALALLAIAVNGYHPYGEDAANHVAAIKQAMHPDFFPASGFFVAPYVRLSLFAHVSAWIIELLHAPIQYVLLAMQIVATWLLLYACLQLAKRCFDSTRPAIAGATPEQWGAVALVAVCLSVPLAGSSFFVMDPYLTSRSFSTPLALLAIAAALDAKWLRTSLFLLLVALFHPLMAIYTLAPVCLIAAINRRAWLVLTGLISAAIAAGFIIQFSQRSVVESPAYRYAVETRYYVFLQWWHWYELVGLFAPLVLLFTYSRWQRRSSPPAGIVLAETCTLLGATAAVVCLLFARPSSSSYLIAASLQPMRQLQLLYICMFLIIGGLLARFWLKRFVWRWAILFGVLSMSLATVQHSIYPASAQVELPWVASSNDWNRAFLWIRDNTAPRTIVALDADYIHAPGEDSQGFRAIAERDALGDRSKDGGAAAVFPMLADRWMAEQAATTGLNQIDDAERLRRLMPFHVEWVVLDGAAPTQMVCPFTSSTVKVCRLH